MFGFTNSLLSVNENAGTYNVVIVRTNGLIATNGPVSFVFMTADGNGPTGAVAGFHYTAISNVVTFADYQTSTNFLLTIANDSFTNADRNLVLFLTNATGGASFVPMSAVSSAMRC